MDNNTQQDLIKTLALFADGKPRDVSDGSVVDVAHAKWLYDEGFLKGIDATTIHDSTPTFLNLTITSPGIEFLQQKQKEITDRPSEETQYKTKHPIRAEIVAQAAAALFVAAVLAYFAWVAHG